MARVSPDTVAAATSEIGPSTLRAGRFRLKLDRPLVMGILNVTPDSFSDGGRYVDRAAAIDHARRLIEAGADILDIGGESTRPGSEPVPVDEELARVLPVIEALADGPIPLSVDTSKPAVMRAAAAAGAALINDVFALRQPGALEAAAATDLAVCLMHMQGEPKTMQLAPRYENVVREVHDFLAGRVAVCIAAGIASDRIVLDPGFGFGKKTIHNLQLLRGLGRIGVGERPILVGLSRKSVLGTIIDRPPDERTSASVAAALAAVVRGAAIVRVHDVAATCDALAVWRAIEEGEQG
ncbi:MAG: dihydropteroate synthase [Burkholderiales bacterium]|nr:dihydropteroate synthase [Burkholderiales bacterium]